MQNDIKKTILEHISKTTLNFLHDDIGMKNLEVTELKSIELRKYFSRVDYKGILNIKVICIIDDNLLKKIFKVFIPEELDSSEEEDMLKEMPDEIANTITGLSISNFPKPYNELTLSPPIKITHQYIKKLSKLFIFVGKLIKTESGNFQLIVSD